MFRKKKQPNLDDFKKNVRRGSHIALNRLKGFYTHHLLVTEVDNNAIKVIEYGSPINFKSMTSAALAKYLGKIHERQINFDELFCPNASDVFLVYCDDYPETDEERNAAIQRAKSRLGENQYCITCNNCEHFVTWALTGKPISMQWINAGAFCRCIADVYTALAPEFISDIQLLVQKNLPKVFSNIQLLVQKYLPKTKVFPQCLSKLKEKCLKYLPKGVALDKLRACISSIRELDDLLVILFLLLKIVAFCIERRHSVGEIIFEVIKIVLQICSILLLGIHPQLLEILETLDLWRRNDISTVDMLRELFKISMSYLVNLAIAIYLPAPITFLIQVLGKSAVAKYLPASIPFFIEMLGKSASAKCFPASIPFFIAKSLPAASIPFFIQVLGKSAFGNCLPASIPFLFQASEKSAFAKCLPASIPYFMQVLGKSLITCVVSSVAGFVFDIGDMILSKLLLCWCC